MTNLREAIGIAIGRRAGLRDDNLTEDGRLAAQALGDAALAAIEAAGFAVAPREATRDMQQYGAAEMREQETAQPGVVGYQQAAAIYTAMLAKAAKP